MRVGIDLRSQYSEFSAGAEYIFWNIIPYLFSHSDYHFVLFVDSCIGEKKLRRLECYQKKYHNVELIVSPVLNVLRRRMIGTLQDAPRDRLSKNLDVVWVPWVSSLSNRSSLPIVQSYYNLAWKRFREMLPIQTRIRNIFKTPGREASFASHVVVPFQSIAEDLEQYYSIHPRSISVIPLGMSRPRVFSHEERRIFQRYSLPSSYILSVLQYGWQDAIESILHAYAGLLEKNRCSYPLVVVTPYRAIPKHVLRCIKTLQISSSVYLFHSFPSKYWQLLYERAVMFVHGSLYDGGVPFVLRALSFGTPVVCGNSGVLSEMTNDAAITVDFGRANDIAIAMDQLLQSEELWYEYQRRGLIQSQQFSWDESSKALIDVFSRAHL